MVDRTREFSMRELTTKVTSGGRITIPAEVRQILGLKPGDRVALVIASEGVPTVFLRRARSVADDSFGVFAAGAGPPNLDEARRVVREDDTDHVVQDGLPDR